MKKRVTISIEDSILNELDMDVIKGLACDRSERISMLLLLGKQKEKDDVEDIPHHKRFLHREG